MYSNNYVALISKVQGQCGLKASLQPPMNLATQRVLLMCEPASHASHSASHASHSASHASHASHNASHASHTASHAIHASQGASHASHRFNVKNNQIMEIII